eukprot:1173775-Amphidinium_carterae.1
MEEDVASKRICRAKLSWRKTKTWRRRACRVGSGATQSSLPTIREEKACDAFRDRKSDAALEDLQRRRLGGATMFTSTLRSLSEPGCRSSGTSGARPNRMRSASSEQEELDVLGKNLHKYLGTRSCLFAGKRMRRTSSLFNNDVVHVCATPVSAPSMPLLTRLAAYCLCSRQ